MLKVYILMKPWPIFKYTLFFLFMGLNCFAAEFALNEDYNYFQKNPKSSLSVEEAQLLNKYHIVFIAGFLNERARDRYFRDNANALREHKIENISLIFPSSKKSITTNVSYVRSELKKIYEQGQKKPLIIFGHSKGGLEVISLVLQEPELLNFQIERIIAMQSPINGNVFLDHWINQGSIHFSVLDGMNSLRGEQVYKIVHEKFMQLNNEQQSLVSSRVYFISTARKPSEVAFVFRIPAYMLSTIKEPSDGVIATKNMTFDLFGKILGHVKSDHTELVIGAVRGLNIATPEKTRAFTLAVFKNLIKDLQTK